MEPFYQDEIYPIYPPPQLDHTSFYIYNIHISIHTWEAQVVLKDQKKRVNIVLNESQRKFLQCMSEERGISSSEIVRELIEEKKKSGTNFTPVESG